MTAKPHITLALLATAAALLTGCCPAAAPEAVVVTQIVEKEGETVVVTMEAEKEMAALPTSAPSDAWEAEAEPIAGTGAERELRPITLNAGMVDDNKQWDDYLLYRQQSADIVSSDTIHDRDVSERYIVTVLDQEGYPVLGARVGFYADQEEVFAGYTYATGKVLFFPKACGVGDNVEIVEAHISGNGYTEKARLVRGETYNLTVTVDTGVPHNFSPTLDVVFLLDATGSMGDEIDALKTNIHSIASEIASLQTVSDIRFGLTVYRDRGDSFVIRTYDLAQVSEFAETLSTIEADGGGDYPESVNEGLHEAIHAPSWRDDAVHIIIWIGDAPPHMDYAQDYDYAAEMEEAARRGIKIFAIAASGLDFYGEYIWRQVAQFTEGKFIFLTYADATRSEPGGETEFHVDQYSVENLDALVVRLITEELAWQTKVKD
jgi:hypothetical protein